jgi:uncharacterized protein (TIGR03000 family)
MFTLRLLLLLSAALTPLPVIAGDVQAASRTTAQVTSRVTVTLPQNDAELTVDGKNIAGDGTSRTFETDPLPRGSRQSYTFSVTWKPNTYTDMARTRIVSFRAGEAVTVDLTRDDPTDRVRVMYVPTPEDVAQAMVRLARVSASDIVFEPGCGDARITIAAVKAGARRGVGIDIDPDRVAESRENVKTAGLTDRIEIRLGDALEIPDLSNASVVFLYMGDHFNMLIRPILWKQLKVGSRVVSHRFKMGDWEPDQTITVTSDEFGDYDLHLWTITEDIKRKLEQR